MLNLNLNPISDFRETGLCTSCRLLLFGAPPQPPLSPTLCLWLCAKLFCWPPIQSLLFPAKHAPWCLCGPIQMWLAALHEMVSISTQLTRAALHCWRPGLWSHLETYFGTVVFLRKAGERKLKNSFSIENSFSIPFPDVAEALMDLKLFLSIRGDGSLYLLHSCNETFLYRL